MAPIKSLAGTKLLVQIGNGATPEAFAHDCLINSERGIKFSSEVGEDIIPDDTLPEQPGWKEQTVFGFGGEINGAGMLHTASVSTWFNWMASGASKSVRVMLNTPRASGGGYFAMKVKLTEFEVSGSNKDKCTVSIKLVADGVATWTDAAA